jgi:hypothetical protein
MTNQTRNRLNDARSRRESYDRSAWDWSDLCREGFSQKQIFSPYDCDNIFPLAPEKPIVLECWKYDGEDASLDSRIESIDDDMVDHWLREPYPLRDGRKPSAGLKVIQMLQTEASLVPCEKSILVAIKKEFRLPSVELHCSSSDTGGCGVFSSTDLCPGTYLATLISSIAVN